MDNMEYNLGIMAMFDIMKVDSKNAIIMYKKLSILKPEFISDLLNTFVLTTYDSHLLTPMSVKNIEVLFDKLYDDCKGKTKTTVHLNKNYYEAKKYFKKIKIDKDYKLLFDDISKRYFGVNNFFKEVKYKKKIEEFYLKNYETIIDDITFDAYVFRYFLDDNFNENFIINRQFVNSIRYLYLSKKDLFDNEIIRNKTKKILLTLKASMNNQKEKGEINKVLRMVVKNGRRNN